jgi:hypothetical protein
MAPAFRDRRIMGTRFRCTTMLPHGVACAGSPSIYIGKRGRWGMTMAEHSHGRQHSGAGNLQKLRGWRVQPVRWRFRRIYYGCGSRKLSLQVRAVMSMSAIRAGRALFGMLAPILGQFLKQSIPFGNVPCLRAFQSP